MRAAATDPRVQPVLNLATNPNVVGTTGFGNSGDGVFSRSTDWAASGTTSALITPVKTTNDSFISVGGDIGAIRLGMIPGRTYTISATVYTPVAQTGTLSGGSARSILFVMRAPSEHGGGYDSHLSQPGPATGAARVSVTATIPADAAEAFVRLYNGASSGGGLVYWDEIMIQEGSVVGEYFDGGTPGARWLGTPNASPSVRWPASI